MLLLSREDKDLSTVFQTFFELFSAWHLSFLAGHKANFCTAQYSMEPAFSKRFPCRAKGPGGGGWRGLNLKAALGLYPPGLEFLTHRTASEAVSNLPAATTGLFSSGTSRFLS